jgi:hypothetical protein
MYVLKELLYKNIRVVLNNKNWEFVRFLFNEHVRICWDWGSNAGNWILCTGSQEELTISKYYKCIVFTLSTVDNITIWKGPVTVE